MSKNNSTILCISDLHSPAMHPDTVDFLREVKEFYKPTRIICLGDEIDHHAMSFHDTDPDLPNAGDELQDAIEKLRPIYKMFPKVDLIDSNHGSMHYRKGRHHGIPRAYLRSYGEILDAPLGWKWHKDLTITLPNGQLCYFHHGLRKDGMKLAQMMGCNVVQGHYHTEFNTKYASSPSQLYWSMQIGCSIDDDHLAFLYNKTTDLRPIIGHGLIVDSHPMLLPMVLNDKGRWVGRLF